MTVQIQCLDCSGLSTTVFTRTLSPADTASLASFVHDTVGALNTRAAAGVWRATATGNQSGATYDVLFRIVATPVPCGTQVSTPDLVATSDSGRFDDDNVTNVAQPTFLVGGTPLFTIQLLEGDAVLGQAIADALGSALIVPDAPFADGVHLISAWVLNAEGTPGAPSEALAVTIDTTPPDAPPLALLPEEDTGFFSDDNITSISTLHLTGLGEAGSSVAYSELFSGAFAGTVDADPLSGRWAFTLGPLADGLYLVDAFATDLAGNVGWDSFLAITIDTQAPATPDFTLAPGADTGSFDSDRITNLSTLDFFGATEPYSTVYFTNTANGVTYGLSADEFGFWAAELADLTDGTYLLTAIAYDWAGNVSGTAQLSVLIDRTPPTIIGARDKAANAAGWNNSDVTVSFVLLPIDVRGGVVRAAAGDR